MPASRSRILYRLSPLVLLLAMGCSSEKPQAPATTDEPSSNQSASYGNGLLLSLAVLGKAPDGKPLPQPAQLGMLKMQDGSWSYSTLEDSDSNVFHKAMVFRADDLGEGILTVGGSEAVIKLWQSGREPIELWRADFGGRFSRMRDVEIADLYGDGRPALAVATHDQGVVATVRTDDSGGRQVQELDRKADTFVHEIEVGDLDGDGTLEIYATPSARNKLDGSSQAGSVTRYVPAQGGERTVIVDMDDRHAKEILVEDVDGDGRDELYVVIEAVSGGEVEILRFTADNQALADTSAQTDSGRRIAALPDKLCRFLTVGDVDGDGSKEMVAAGSKSGLWLLEPGDDPSEPWKKTSIDRDSGGFEHAALLTDLDDDGKDELYVASDTHGEVRQYRWRDGVPWREVIHRHPGGLQGFTWNLMPFPVRLEVGNE